MDSDACIADIDPILLGPTNDGLFIAMPAERRVQSGDRLQNVLEKSENNDAGLMLALPVLLISVAESSKLFNGP